jgi:PIN domain nuclease of toxin-antitoxin system
MTKLLLDTHVVLWWFANEPLGDEADAAIRASRSVVCVSAVSAVEIGLKSAIGKLSAPDDLEGQLRRHRFTPLPVTIAHGTRLGELPVHHGDPFDRLLVAQAQLEGLTIVTRDPRIAAYDVETLAA